MDNLPQPNIEQLTLSDNESLKKCRHPDEEYSTNNSLSEDSDRDFADPGPSNQTESTKAVVANLPSRQIKSLVDRSRKAKRSKHRSFKSSPGGSVNDSLGRSQEGLSVTRRYPHVADFCVDCVHLVETVIVDGQQFTRALGSFMALERSATSCLLCNLFLRILKGRNESVLTQAKAYDDASFNRIKQYDENGVSDVEELSNPTTRVRVDLQASMFFTNTSEYVGNEPCIGLLLVFGVHFNSRRSGQHKVHVSSAETRVLQNVIAVFKHEVVEDCSSVMNLRIGDTRLDRDRKLDLIMRWLSDTETRISKIQNANAPANEEGPCRLVKICSEEHIQLVELDYQSSQVTPKYLALSHRWGRRQHLTTTGANIEAHKARITLNDLPGTFRDAITVTRLLGYLYIWIDALCIIQDSASDWHTESQKMGDIFRGASITLAAHCAKDDSEGFLNRTFSKRPITEYRTKSDHIGFFQPPNPEEDVTSSALSRRAWVLQERFLSTRTLHFTAGQIYMENTDGIFCEEGILYESQEIHADVFRAHGDGPDRLGNSYLSPSAVPYLREALGFNAHFSTETGSIEWLPLVEMYTRCGLTNESDKLVAIAGMARRIQSWTKDAWCAGLWDNTLVQGMLWLGELAGLSAPTTPRAPSWSWAAWDGPIQYPQMILAETFTPRVSFVTLQDADYQVTSWLSGPGYLTLFGRMVPLNDLSFGSDVVLGPGPSRPGPYTENHAHLPRLHLLHFIRAQGLIWRPKDRAIHGDRKSVGWVTFDDPDIAFIRNAGRPPPLWFIVLATDEPPVYYGTYLGIFVVKSNTNQPIYRRVGFGQISSLYLFDIGFMSKLLVDELGSYDITRISRKDQIVRDFFGRCNCTKFVLE